MLNILLAQALDSTPSASPSVTTPNVDLLGGLTDKIFQVNADPETIPMALNTLWTIAMKGNLYNLVCSLGLFIAVIATGFWCVKFYKAMEEGSMKPVVNEVIVPILVILMLTNNGRNLRDLTLATRDMMNGFNHSINQVVSNEVSFRSALRILGTTDAAVTYVDKLYAKCEAQIDSAKFQECTQTQAAAAQAFIFSANKVTGSNSLSAKNSVDWQKQIKNWQDYTSKYSSNRFNVSSVEGTDKILDITKIGKGANGAAGAFNDTQDLRRVILSFRGSFLYIIEVMMLVTGLMGPVFVALSLFPVGSKPIVGWGTSFLSLGFCKICFTLISGLSSVAMVYSGPENVDMLVAAIVLGLLAPALSFGLASGTGISAMNNIGYISPSFGLNTGVGMYNTTTGQGAPMNTPDGNNTNVGRPQNY